MSNNSNSNNYRGGDVQVAKMMMRRVQQNLTKVDKSHQANAAKSLEMPLNGLYRVSHTTGDYLRDSKGLEKLVAVIKQNRDHPHVLKLAVMVIDNAIRFTESESTRQRSATQMTDLGLFDELVEIMEQYLTTTDGYIPTTKLTGDSSDNDDTTTTNKDLIRSTINLVIVLCNYWRDHPDIDKFRLHCAHETSILTQTVDAMQQYMDDERICESGVYVIYWLMCSHDETVQRAVIGTKLNIAIEAALDDFDGKLDRSDNRELHKFLGLPNLQDAIHADPVMGVLRKVYDMHKNQSSEIQHYGLEVQLAMLVRQKRDRKLFQCMNCEKKLSKQERLICAGCRGAIYCSKECQRTHWKQTHKKECNKQCQ